MSERDALISHTSHGYACVQCSSQHERVRTCEVTFDSRFVSAVARVDMFVSTVAVHVCEQPVVKVPDGSGYRMCQFF